MNLCPMNAAKLFGTLLFFWLPWHSVAMSSQCGYVPCVLPFLFLNCLPGSCTDRCLVHVMSSTEKMFLLHFLITEKPLVLHCTSVEWSVQSLLVRKLLHFLAGISSGALNFSGFALSLCSLSHHEINSPMLPLKSCILPK